MPWFVLGPAVPLYSPYMLTLLVSPLLRVVSTTCGRAGRAAVCSLSSTYPIDAPVDAISRYLTLCRSPLSLWSLRILYSPHYTLCCKHFTRVSSVYHHVTVCRGDDIGEAVARTRVHRARAPADIARVVVADPVGAHDLELGREQGRDRIGAGNYPLDKCGNPGAGGLSAEVCPDRAGCVAGAVRL